MCRACDGRVFLRAISAEQPEVCWKATRRPNFHGNNRAAQRRLPGILDRFGQPPPRSIVFVSDIGLRLRPSATRAHFSGIVSRPGSDVTGGRFRATGQAETCFKVLGGQGPDSGGAGSGCPSRANACAHRAGAGDSSRRTEAGGLARFFPNEVASPAHSIFLTVDCGESAFQWGFFPPPALGKTG